MLGALAAYIDLLTFPVLSLTLPLTTALLYGLVSKLGAPGVSYWCRQRCLCAG